MKGTSKLIMGATLVMVVSLAIVLALILVLLVELYCSILLRRRQLRKMTSNTANATPATTSTNDYQSATPSLSSFGVLRAPGNFLFPEVSGNDKFDLEKQHSNCPQAYASQSPQLNSIPHRVGLLPPSPPSPLRGGNVNTSSNGVLAGVKDHFMYISNPIYDNETSRLSNADTPFETPDTSPSRLEIGDSSSSNDDIGDGQSLSSFPNTPPLTPMQKLPAEACSVSLRDARFLATSGSDSYGNNNNGLSSSSSGSPSNSPSW